MYQKGHSTKSIEFLSGEVCKMLLFSSTFTRLADGLSGNRQQLKGKDQLGAEFGAWLKNQE
jgi:hypothetical protein